MLLLAAGCGGEPAEYPNRRITLVVHAAPGGISDAVSRYVARELEEGLGVPVVPENRSGAAGSVALSYVARQPADGYTIGYAPVDLAILDHLGYAEVTPSDFDFLAMHTRAPAVLVVGEDAPWNTLEPFLEHARTNPGDVQMGTAGTGSIWHLASLSLARATGAEFNYVPFDGAAPAVTALLGGHVDAVVAGPAEVQSHVESGDMRVLGVMSDRPSMLFPDAPLLSSAGYEVTTSAWGGFLAPSGLPAARRDTLTAELARIIDSEEFAAFCEKRGLERVQRVGPEFAEFVRNEYERFGELVEAMDLNVQAGS